MDKVNSGNQQRGLKMIWPKEVPVVTVDDMCIGPFHKGKCGCILYWLGSIFVDPNYNRSDLWDVADGVSVELGLDDTAGTTWGDVGRVTKKNAARVVNRTTAKLGYVWGNPECDSNGKLRPVK